MSNTKGNTTMTRLATSIYNAAHILFDMGFEGSEIETILNALPQPGAGLVYIADVMEVAA